MRVCNICLGVPEYTGSPTIGKLNDSSQKKYLLGVNFQSAIADLCEKCLDNLQNGRWDKLAESSHDVLMLRLGVQPGAKPDD